MIEMAFWKKPWKSVNKLECFGEVKSLQLRRSLENCFLQLEMISISQKYIPSYGPLDFKLIAINPEARGFIAQLDLFMNLRVLEETGEIERKGEAFFHKGEDRNKSPNTTFVITFYDKRL
ncbi:hypothetical protein HYV80_00635 [Candidatus Woesearchaeota archaeon]|nr:hypothetical protein [Candidatus Woesearchaeota archaeon]